MRNFIRKTAKSVLPATWRDFLRRMLNIRPPKDSEFAGMTNAEIFGEIYRNNLWGTPGFGKRAFWSGSGTHDTRIASGYIAAVKEFLVSLPEKPSIADLGCGDFIVGSNFVSLAINYVACDIFEGVIEENRKIYRENNLEFRVLDLSRDLLPEADVIIVRQVLQHLSNADIFRFAHSLPGLYKYLILTEHVPASSDFSPNLDKVTGPGTRLDIGSGVVLTAQPFNLKVKSERLLCEFAEHGGLVRTIVYSF